MSRLGVPRGIRAGGPRLRASNRKTCWRPDSNLQSSQTNLQSPISLPDPQFGRWSVRVLKPATLTFAQGDLASRDAVVKTRGMYRHRHRGRGLASLALGLVILRPRPLVPAVVPLDLRAVAALSPAVVRVSLYPSGGLETMTPRSGGAACGLLGAPG